MKRRIAKLLRRQANRLDPQPPTLMLTRDIPTTTTTTSGTIWTGSYTLHPGENR